MRLIDGDKLIKQALEVSYPVIHGHNDHENGLTLSGLAQLLDEQPVIKPESPVLCKDCLHFVRDDIEEYTPYGFYNTYFHAFCDKHWDKEKGEYIDVHTDDYCSWAERRER